MLTFVYINHGAYPLHYVKPKPSKSMDIDREPIIKPTEQSVEQTHSMPIWRRLLRRWYLWGCFLPFLVLLYFVYFGERPIRELWLIQERGEMLEKQLDSLKRFEAQYQERMQQLQDAEGVERMARERYLMKAPGEEVFVIRSVDLAASED